MPLSKDDVRRISWGNGNGWGKKETVWGSGQILVIIVSVPHIVRLSWIATGQIIMWALQ